MSESRIVVTPCPICTPTTTCMEHAGYVPTDTTRAASLRFPADLPAHPRRRLQDRALRDALLGLPHGVYEGANRYDTDNEHVLHLWRDGESFDIRLAALRAAANPEREGHEHEVEGETVTADGTALSCSWCSPRTEEPDAD